MWLGYRRPGAGSPWRGRAWFDAFGRDGWDSAAAFGAGGKGRWDSSHRPHRASRPRDVLTGPCSPPTPGGFSHLIDGPNRTEVQRHLVAGLCPAAPELPCGEPAAQQSHLEGWAVRVAGPHTGSTQTVPRPQGASSRQGRLTHVLKVTRDTGWGVGSCVSPSCPAVARWAPSCLPTSSSHPPHPCP